MPKIDTPITANAETLDLTLSTSLPSVLMLYNSQKGSLSSELDQTMKRLAKSEAQKLLIIKADVADNPSLGLKYDLSQGSPLVIAFRDKQEIARRHQPTPGTLENYAAYLLGRSDKIDQVASNGNGKIKTAQPIKVSDSSFVNDVLQSQQPVLVDFWAEWCGPCHMIAPSLEKLAGEFDGQITVAKLNVDENPRTAQQFRVQGIPMLLIFKGGQVADKLVGAAPEPMLRQFIEKNI